MRLYSTPESFQRGLPTWLGVAEFICASAIAAWIVWDGRLVFWLTVASLMAPIFMLRTPRSIQLGVSGMHWWTERIRRYAIRSGAGQAFNDAEYSKASLMLLYSPLAAVVIRF